MRRSAILAVGAVFVAIGLVEAVTGSKKAAPAGPSFQPWAASFVSPSTGFVLGGVGCRFVPGVQHPCAAVVEATSDGGATWRRLAAPGPRLEPIQSSFFTAPVSAITFADARNGWLYDAGLWATHDGGGHWSRIALKARVTAVVAAGGWAYAAVNGGSATGVRHTGPVGKPPLTDPVLRTPVGRDDWQPVRALPQIATNGYPSQLAAAGAAAFAGLQLANGATQLWSGARDRWHRIASPCTNAGPFDELDAVSPDALVALCAEPVIVISTDAGAHARRAALPKGLPAIGPLGVPTGQARVILVASPGRGYALVGIRPVPGVIYRTTDAGHTWTRTTYADHGAGFADLQFTSPTVGWVVHGSPGAGTDQLLQTTDAGATFAPVAF